MHSAGFPEPSVQPAQLLTAPPDLQVHAIVQAWLPTRFEATQALDFVHPFGCIVLPMQDVSAGCSLCLSGRIQT